MPLDEVQKCLTIVLSQSMHFQKIQKRAIHIGKNLIFQHTQSMQIRIVTAKMAIGLRTQSGTSQERKKNVNQNAMSQNVQLSFDCIQTASVILKQLLCQKLKERIVVVIVLFHKNVTSPYIHNNKRTQIAEAFDDEQIILLNAFR